MGASDHNDRSQDAPQLLGATAFKPPERHGLDIVKYLIYDKEKGEFFTRTPKSWALITIFYLIYYTCLAAFWYGMLQLFFMTVTLDQPKYLLEENIIGNNPGVGMRPRQADANIDSSMLFLNAREFKGSARAQPDFEGTTNADWEGRYAAYIKSYENTTGIQDCTADTELKKGDKACKFDTATLGECGVAPFGYFAEKGDKNSQASPCILLKVNRIFGWQPQPYDLQYIDADQEEDDPIPGDVRKLIEQDPNQIYVDCFGENPADVEALDGNVKYFPENRGIPFYYFPYTQAHNNYHNPLVAVKFNNLNPGQLIHVECKLWAKGIKHDRKDKLGGIRFEILLEESADRRDKREL